MQTRGDKAMHVGVKGVIVAAAFGFSYIDHVFSPLIWALLALIVFDVLMNVHKEGEQLNKIGSAFMTLSGTSLISYMHGLNTETVHGIVAVMVLAYIQVDSPQIVNLIKKAKFLAPAAKDEALLAMQAELQALRQVAAAQAEKDKVIVTAGEQK